MALIFSNKSDRCSGIRRQESRQGLQSGLLVEGQLGPLLADDRLVVGKGDVRVGFRDTPQDLEGASV